jgi:hypothetical protein
MFVSSDVMKSFATAALAVMAVASASCGTDQATDRATATAGIAKSTESRSRSPERVVTQLVTTPSGAPSESALAVNTPVGLPSPASVPTSVATNLPLPGGENWATIDIGQFSDFQSESPVVQIVGDQMQWVELWRKHRSGSQDPPHVDFGGRSIVALFLGTGGGGDSVAVTSIEISGDAAVVHAVKNTPAPGCGVSAVITYPYHIVSFESRPTSAMLDLTTRTTPC